VNGWQVGFADDALTQYQALPGHVRKEVVEILWELREDGPEIFGAIQLRSNRDTWRVRFGSGRYRMLYEASHRKKRIFISRLELRKNAYNGLRG
jgi:mRNA-degrading endonuclease RelE of RelBE toxin-antitoxin system